MSMNIYLEGKRTLTTKSGRTAIDRKQVDRIRQTPTSVTYDILSKPTFEERLAAYCEWEESHCGSDDAYWSRVYRYDEGLLDLYKKYNNSDYVCEYEDGEESYKELRTEYVEEIVYPDDDRFEELSGGEEDVIAVVGLRSRPVKEILQKIVKDMVKEEYELEWGMI